MDGQGTSDTPGQGGTWGQTLPALRNMQQNQFRPWMQGFNQNLQTDLGNLRQFLGTQPWNQPGFNAGAFNSALQGQLSPFRTFLSNVPRLPHFPWMSGGVPPMSPIQPRPEPVQPQFLGPPVTGGMGDGSRIGTNSGMGASMVHTDMQPFSWLGETGAGGGGGGEPTRGLLPSPSNWANWGAQFGVNTG